MPTTTPNDAPDPRAALGTDLTNYFVLRTDATGRVQVRGEDQLFSYREALLELYSGVPSGADGRVRVGPVPANRIWVVTNVAVRDQTTPLTAVTLEVQRVAVGYNFYEELAAIAIGEWATWGGHVYADAGDYIRAWLTGCLAGDTCAIEITGYVMTKE